MTSTIILDAARQYAEKHKFTTFTLPMRWDETTNKKKAIHPDNWSQYTLTSPSFDDRHNSAHTGIAIVTGERSGIAVVDSDNSNHWERVKAHLGWTSDPNTPTERTQNGGLHFLYKYTEELKDLKSTSKVITIDNKQLDIDIKTNGGMLYCAPSYLENAPERKYEWLPGKSIDEIPLAEMPRDLLDLIRASTSSKAPRGRPSKKSGESSKSTPTESAVSDKLKAFILETTNILPKKLQKIMYDPDFDTYLIQTKESVCIFIGDEHKSNHQYLVIKRVSSDPEARETWKLVRKCHDDGEKCKDKEKEWPIPKDISDQLPCYTDTTGKPANMVVVYQEAKDQVKQAFFHSDINHMEQQSDKSLAGPMTKAFGYDTCWECKVGKITGKVNHKGVYVQCDNCGSRHPPGDAAIPIDRQAFPNLDQYLLQFVIQVNNNQQIQNNYYGGTAQSTDGTDLTIGWNEFVEDKLQLDQDQALNDLILASLSGTHMRVADLAFYFLGDSLAYCVVQNKWYSWGPHLWHEVPSEEIHSLLRKSKLTSSLVKAKKVYENSSVKLKDRKIVQIQKVITQLENNGYQNAIIEQLKIQCKKPKTEFFDKLDKNTNLWAFTNGIYDLSRDEFRDGKSEDFVTMSCGYDWDPTKMKDPKCTAEVQDFLSKVFPNQEVRDCFLKVCSSALAGYTGDQVLYFCHGGGSNGKGVISNLLLLVFGDHGGTLQASFLTGRTPDANSPTPALTSMIGKRLIITQEIDPGSSLNVPLFKSITGQDRMQFRPMYGECREFVPTSQLLFMCNHLPKFPGEDEAMRRRIETIPFISTFKDIEEGMGLDPSKNEFPKDKDLTQKLDTWKWSFIQTLFHYYCRFRQEGIKIPPIMKEMKMKYVMGNDVWSLVKDELFDKTESGGVRSTEVKDKVVKWLVNNGFSVPRPSELQRQLDLMLKGAECKNSNDRRFTDANGTQKTGYSHWKFRTDE